jgi:hypothetical protein
MERGGWERERGGRERGRERERQTVGNWSAALPLEPTGE